LTSRHTIFLENMTEENPDEIGGRKSRAHLLSQDRLVRIFSYRYKTQKEYKVTAIDNKDYWIDVMLMHKSKADTLILSSALEVDTYRYGIQKKKSPRHIKNRDSVIMQTLNIPVIRIDVDALKEGRMKTKYYLNDGELVSYVYNKTVEYWSNAEKYISEVQRG